MRAQQPSLRPQDLAVAVWLALEPNEHYERMAEALSHSLSGTHRSVQRLRQAGLLLPDERKVNRSALLEFLRYGVRYVFPPSRGPEVRGMPTAWSAPVLEGELPVSAKAIVWPDVRGSMRGESVAPLYDGAPRASDRDFRLYRSLALIDALRLGQARERKIAGDLLSKELMVA